MSAMPSSILKMVMSYSFAILKATIGNIYFKLQDIAAHIEQSLWNCLRALHTADSLILGD